MLCLLHVLVFVIRKYYLSFLLIIIYYVGDEKQSNMMKTVLFVGEKRSGKTSLINLLTNYALGVQWEDPFRFDSTCHENTSIFQVLMWIPVLRHVYFISFCSKNNMIIVFVRTAVRQSGRLYFRWSEQWFPGDDLSFHCIIKIKLRHFKLMSDYPKTHIKNTRKVVFQRVIFIISLI